MVEKSVLGESDPSASEQLGAAVGVKPDRILGARYGDVDRRSIDGVGAEALQVGHDPIGGCALCGMDGADPSGPDMAIGEPGEVERLVLAVLAVDGDAAALRIDPDHAGDW